MRSDGCGLEEWNIGMMERWNGESIMEEGLQGVFYPSTVLRCFQRNGFGAIEESYSGDGDELGGDGWSFGWLPAGNRTVMSGW